jgi:hypothetical protein
MQIKNFLEAAAQKFPANGVGELVDKGSNIMMGY